MVDVSYEAGEMIAEACAVELQDAAEERQREHDPQCAQTSSLPNCAHLRAEDLSAPEIKAIVENLNKPSKSLGLPSTAQKSPTRASLSAARSAKPFTPLSNAIDWAANFRNEELSYFFIVNAWNFTGDVFNTFYRIQSNGIGSLQLNRVIEVFGKIACEANAMIDLLI
jgi:hypothetical protein